jgi:predicted small secreted protein
MKYLQRLIAWFLGSRCGGAFHNGPYGERGRYVALLTEGQYHRAMAAVVVLAALSLGGCATLEGKASIGRGGAKVDQAVVESFLRFGDEARAREYLLRLGLSEAEIMARLQLAREAAAKAATVAAKEKQ